MRPLLIESLRVEADGRMPLLPWHLERLGHTSGFLDYRWSVDAVQRAIARAAAELPEGIAHRLRVQVSDNGRIEIDRGPLPARPAPLRVGIARERLDPREPLLRHSTTHRPWFAEADTAMPAGVDELLYANTRGELCGGSRHNVYLLMEGAWRTPAETSGALPGVQRAALLDDEAVEEAVLRLDDLRRAQGIRLSNAVHGWFDVTLAATRTADAHALGG